MFRGVLGKEDKCFSNADEWQDFSKAAVLQFLVETGGGYAIRGGNLSNTTPPPGNAEK